MKYYSKNIRLWYDNTFHPLPWIIERKFLWVFWRTWATCKTLNRAEYLIGKLLENESK